MSRWTEERLLSALVGNEAKLAQAKKRRKQTIEFRKSGHAKYPTALLLLYNDFV